MRILFICRPTVYTVPGGDTVQIKKTAAELQKLGVHVDINTADTKPDYTQYDLLHFFNIIDCEDLLGHALRCNKPFLISTIYVDYSEYDRYHRSGAIGLLSRLLPYHGVEYLKTLAKRILKGERVSTYRYWLKGHGRSIRYLLQHAACLLPNSANEYQRLLRDFGIEKNYQVVPNGFDPALFSGTNPHSTRAGVLCVARIEGRKNQLNLIRALNGTSIPLTLIGPTAPNQKSYYDQCRREAGPNVTFIDNIPQQELVAYYRQSKVHVLPSWFETTGLSSLEAAAMGCTLVLADRGDVRDYFGDYAYYCEPGNVESVKQAVLTATKTPFNEELMQHVQKNFTWQHAAQATLHAYNRVLLHK